MTSLTTASPPAHAAALPRALVRLSARAQRELWGIRLTRLYAFGIGISYSALVLTGPLSPGIAPRLWMKALTTASWIAGIGALSLARELTERDTTQGVTALAQLRGYGARELERARVVAGAIKLASTVAIPGALVALTALVRWRSLSGTATALALLLFTALYAALFGGTLSALARACSRTLPGRGRLLLLVVVLGPWLLASGIGAHLPNIPGGLGWLLARLSEGSR